MLARLPPSLPSAAASLAKVAPYLHRLPPHIRYNSSTATSTRSEGNTEATPKRRAIPLAKNLGDVNIANPRKYAGSDQRRGGGHQWSRAVGNGGQQQRQHADGNATQRQGQNGGRKNGGQLQRQNNRDRPSPQKDWISRPRTLADPNADLDLRSKSDNTDSQSAAPNPLTDAEQPRRPQQQQAEHRTPRKTPRTTAKPRDKVVIPDPKEIELGNLDALFNSPGLQSSSSSRHTRNAAAGVTPSQARTQLLLERTAGDYSRYVPKPYPTTDVTRLGTVGLADFVLSRKRDASLGARQHALTVVQKFSGGGSRAQIISS